MVLLLRSQVLGLVRVAGWALSAVLVWLGLAASLPAQQQPAVHLLNAGIMPPGAIGSQQLMRGGPLPGYFQPVEIVAPPGARVSTASEGQFDGPQSGPIVLGMLIGGVYRLRVTNIPNQETLEVYPTVEVIDRLYPPVGMEARFPIVIQLTQEDLELALAGKFVTHIVYLEDPDAAVPLPAQPLDQPFFEIAKGQDPLEVADRLGRPVAIVRLGGRLPDAAGPDQAFLFGSPTFLRFEQTGRGGNACQSRRGGGHIRGNCFRHQRDLGRGIAVSRPSGKLAATAEKAIPVIPPRRFSVEAKPTMTLLACQFESRCNRRAAHSAGKAMLLVASMLLLCSCRANGSRPYGPLPGQGPIAPPTLPPEAFTGGPGDRTTLPATSVPIAPTARWGIPLPETLVTPWAPPGIALPWPRDEYLHDGGEKRPVTVNRNGQVNGLESEDTVVHYDTLDGRTLVEPSNRVDIYVPRFAAVCHVEEAVQSQQRDKISEMELPVAVEQSGERLVVTSAVQPVQPLGDVGIKQPTLARLNQAEAAFSSRLMLSDSRPASNRTRISKPSAWARSRTPKKPGWRRAFSRPLPGRKTKPFRSFSTRQPPWLKRGINGLKPRSAPTSRRIHVCRSSKWLRRTRPSRGSRRVHDSL